MAHHSVEHSLPARDFGLTFPWAIAFNLAYVVVEAGFGFVTGSLALLSDAAGAERAAVVHTASLTSGRQAPRRARSAGAYASSLFLQHSSEVKVWLKQWVDPVTGLMISGLIAWSAFGLLQSALHLEFDGVPHSIEKRAVEDWPGRLPGVASGHDLHIWPMSTTATVLTAHLVMPAANQRDAFLDNVAHELEGRFPIAHATLQTERGDGLECRLAPDSVV